MALRRWKEQLSVLLALHHRNKKLGYVSFSVDGKAVKKALLHQEMLEQFDPYINMSLEEETVSARLKVTTSGRTGGLRYELLKADCFKPPKTAI